jgi:thiamine biosynthesis lipoprotein
VSNLLNSQRAETRIRCFGSSCQVVIDNDAGTAPELLSSAEEELIRVENKFSSYIADSVISAINQSAGTGSFIPLDAEARSLFRYVSALWSESKHLFDPTTLILQDCYDANGRILASSDQLKGMLQLVGWSKLEITGEGARLGKKGMLIDLNSCIRPYAIDCVRKFLVENGICHALIKMEQDMATVGKQPDGANWLVGIRHPRQARTAITRPKLNDKSFAQRGNFERFTLQNDERFGRALSPVDGQPIPGLLSVAVTADTCLTACSAASVARFKTESAGIKWLEGLGLPWMAIDRELNCLGPLAP